MAFVLTAAGGCDLDKLLEERVPEQVNISLSLDRNILIVAPGASATVSASVARFGDYKGPVDLTLANVPNGIAAMLGAPITNGSVTTAPVTFTVPADFAIGSYFVLVRGAAGETGRASQNLELRVALPPGVTAAPLSATVAVIPGGIAPITVALVRTEYASPVTVTLDAPAGVAAVPVVTDGTVASLTLSAAAGLPIGTYPLTLRVRGDGIPDAAVSLTLTVSSDPLQLIAGNVAALQASVADLDVIVNTAPGTGAVTLTGEGLPAGLGVTFVPSAADARRYTARFSVGAGVAAGTHTLTIRARAAGGATTVANVGMAVGASNVAITLVPPTVTVLQGSSAAALLTILRTSYTAAVGVGFIDLPAGLTAEAAEGLVTGSSTTVVISASRQLGPGVYSLGVRVVPSPTAPDGPALDPVVAPMLVNVAAAPAVDGNVVLDWSHCTIPDWVGAQDGTGPWTTLGGVQGIYRFAVTSARGAFAYVESGRLVTVRYGTGAELSTAPIDLCPTVDNAPVHAVTATAVHATSTETFTWRLGGGVGASTLASPNFTINGVRDGTHDLVGYGTTQNLGLRMHLTRDVNQPAGAYLGTVSLLDGNSFTPASGTVTVTGYAAEQPSVVMSYLTTAACTANRLAESSSGSAFVGSANWTVRGVPALWQRASDYHLVELTAVSSSGSRSLTQTFHTLASARSIALPPALSPAIFILSGEHLRLRAFLGAPPEGYNGTLRLSYVVGSQTVFVTSSVAALGSGTVALDMPDFGPVTGFPAAAVAPPGSHGTWSLSVDGASGDATLCAEGASRWSATRRGNF